VRVQAQIQLPEEAYTEIDATPMCWNPEVARGNPAHITIIYHDEAPDVGLLRVRLEEAFGSRSPSLLAESDRRCPVQWDGASGS
jgi:hypothetical protein